MVKILQVYCFLQSIIESGTSSMVAMIFKNLVKHNILRWILLLTSIQLIQATIICETMSNYKPFSLLMNNSVETERSNEIFNILNCKCLYESKNETEHFNIQDIPNYSPKEWTKIKMVKIGDCSSLVLSLPTIFSHKSRVALLIENIGDLTIKNLDIGSDSGGGTDSSIIRKDAISMLSSVHCTRLL